MQARGDAGVALRQMPVDQRVGAERLDQVDIDDQFRLGLGAGLEVLGANAEQHCAALALLGPARTPIRPVSGQADSQAFGLRVVTIGSPNWRAKALRLMKQAEKFGRPVVTLIDTPGAALSREAEEGGLAGEITARINERCFEWLDAPVLRVTAHDIPLPYAPQLEDFVLPQTADVVLAVRRLASY